MKTIRRLLSIVPLLVLWLMLSIFLWGFVFNLITDTGRENKLTLCVNAEAPGATQLAVALEEGLEGSVRMVKVRPFSYAMFDERTLTEADLYLVPASHVETYGDWFRPLPEEAVGEGEILYRDGTPYGIRAYDAKANRGAAADWISYETPEREDFYLLFGQKSLHIPGNENAVDGAALTAAELLLGWIR